MSGFFFSRKGRGRLGERDQGFSFLLHESETTQASEVGAGVWELFLGGPRPRLHATCCAAHQRLLLGFQKKATKGKSEQARFPSNQRSEFPPATSSVPFQIQEGSSTPVDPAEGKLARNRSSPQDSPRFFPSRVASDFETWNLNRSAVLFSRQVGCSCPASR